MPRTTLDLDGSVLRELRLRADRQHKSLGQVASELLAVALAHPDKGDAESRFEWRSADLGMPRVDPRVEDPFG